MSIFVFFQWCEVKLVFFSVFGAASNILTVQMNKAPLWIAKVSMVFHLFRLEFAMSQSASIVFGKCFQRTSNTLCHPSVLLALFA